MEYTWLPMNETLYDSLQWWWENRPVPDASYVFVSEKKELHYGKRFKYRNQFLKQLCKRAKVWKFGYHALRRKAIYFRVL